MRKGVLWSIYQGLVKLGVFYARTRGWGGKQFNADLVERLGQGKWLEITAKDLVWIHAASVGELNGVIPVLENLKGKLTPDELLITTTSTTGQDEIVKKRLCRHHALLPFDRQNIMEVLVGRIKPRLLIITETELWPNLLASVAEAGIPLMLINGRISDYSFPRYKKFRKFLQPLLQEFAVILVQSELDQERFVELGADRKKVIRVGSTKYDKPAPQFDAAALNQLRAEMGLNQDGVTLVAGSVRPGEEEIVIDAYQALKEQQKNFQLIIAPRHATQYDVVEGLLKARQLRMQRRSAGPALAPVDVLLLDTMGELAKTYALGDFAFVGGSLVNIGGHNPFEPASYGKPVIMGPYVNNVREIAGDLQQHGGLLIVPDSAELKRAIEKLLTDRNYREAAGQQAYAVWQKHQGATKEVCAFVEKYLKQ